LFLWSSWYSLPGFQTVNSLFLYLRSFSGARPPPPLSEHLIANYFGYFVCFSNSFYSHVWRDPV
jgi:hypothetical protein